MPKLVGVTGLPWAGARLTLFSALLRAASFALCLAVFGAVLVAPSAPQRTT